jgi:quinol monooxygenase YgiN
MDCVLGIRARFAVVQLTVRLTAKAGRAHQLVQALRTVMQHAVLNGACSGAHIAADVDETNAFWYVEDWQDVRELERQLRTERFSHLLALLETAPVQPLLEFRVVAETRGLEYVAAVREAAEGSGHVEFQPGPRAL